MIFLEKYSYRFAEQVLNSKLSVKEECENIITDIKDFDKLSRPGFNKILKENFEKKGWESEPLVSKGDKDFMRRMDFLKDRVGVEVGFSHPSFIGVDLLKFQVSSYSELDTIDVGIYILTTKNFQKVMNQKYGLKWDSSLNFEKVKKDLPFYKSAIQIPILIYGINIR